MVGKKSLDGNIIEIPTKPDGVLNYPLVGAGSLPTLFVLAGALQAHGCTGLLKNIFRLLKTLSVRRSIIKIV